MVRDFENFQKMENVQVFQIRKLGRANTLQKLVIESFKNLRKIRNYLIMQKYNFGKELISKTVKNIFFQRKF